MSFFQIPCCAGDQYIKNITYLEYARLQLYEYEAGCKTLTQEYDSLPVNDAKIAHKIAIRPLNATVCWFANCMLGSVAIWEHSSETGCVVNASAEPSSALWSGAVFEDTCVTAKLTYNSVSHAISFKLTCDKLVEEDVADGFLPVVAMRMAPTVAQVEFVIILGGASAAQLNEATLDNFKSLVLVCCQGSLLIFCYSDAYCIMQQILFWGRGSHSLPIRSPIFLFAGRKQCRNGLRLAWKIPVH